MASKDPKMSKQHTADKEKEVPLMIQQKLEIIMTEGGKRRREVMASNSSGLSTICDTKKWKDQL